MVRFNSSTWLLFLVFVNVVSAANIEETEDSVKTSFISLLKNIVNINEKRVDAMKHIDDEKDFRLGSYLSKIHKVNDDSQEYETDQKDFLRIIDMRRNLNLASRETFTQPRPVINVHAEMFLPFKRFTFKTLKINNKKKVISNNEKMNNIIFQRGNNIIELPKNYLSKSSIDDIIAKLIQKNDNTLNLPRKYIRKPSIQDLKTKIIKLHDSYQKKSNEVPQKEDIIRKLQDTINILKKTHIIKDQNGNIRRKIGNHNCNDETEEETKCEDDKNIFLCIINCCIFDGKIADDAGKKKPDNVHFVFTFDGGKEGEESQRTDWRYEFVSLFGEAFNSLENKGDRQNARKSLRGSCDKNLAQLCTKACSIAHKNVCTRYKCTRKAKKAFEKECKRSCTAAFVRSEYSKERL